MLYVLLTSAIAFIITFVAIPAIIIIAQQKKLYDIPDARKLHTKPIASLGGVGIFGGFFLAGLLSIAIKTNPEFQYFFAAATLIFFLGIKDDILILSAIKKFIVQVVAAAIIIHLSGLRIESMHGFLGVYELPLAVSLALSYISIIVIINAFNLIDGVDGLAGSLGLMSMLLFGGYFYLVDMTAYALLAFAMAGSLVAFLIFNFNPARIFMGDSGSLLIGLVNAILVLKFISVADTAAVPFTLQSVVAIGFSVLMVPLADTLRVFSIRIFKGRSPFSPDRNHIHHLLLDRGLGQKQVTLTCVMLNAVFIAIAFAGRGFGSSYIMLSITAVACAFLGLLVYFKKPVPKVFVVQPLRHRSKSLGSTNTKVVSIATEVAIVEN